MKKTSKLLIAIFFLSIVQISFSAMKELNRKSLPIVIFQDSNDFSGNYLAKSAKVFAYNKPNSKSKTAVMLPQQVLLIATKKSGSFVFGSFSISSEKSYQGWFRIKELKEIKFTAPKVVKRKP